MSSYRSFLSLATRPVSFQQPPITDRHTQSVCTIHSCSFHPKQTNKQTCLIRGNTLLPSRPQRDGVGLQVGEASLIDVSPSKFSLQLSSRFILPVVIANGRITTGSDHYPWRISRLGGGHLHRLKGVAGPPTAADDVISTH